MFISWFHSIIPTLSSHVLWTGHHVNIRAYKFKYVTMSTDIFQSKSTKPFWHQLWFALEGHSSFLTNFFSIHWVGPTVCTHTTPTNMHYMPTLFFNYYTAIKALVMLGAPFWKEWNAPKLNILVLSLQCWLFAISYQHRNWAPVYRWCHTVYKSCGPAVALLFVD